MGTTRKLQSEIDRTLKKVQEGVELFDEIWNKVYSATNANQKEKYEGDLKKEIKKLQRYRDDIKTWIAKSDIKDKRPLMDARKAIEAEMERFKVCEKEFKTKAFSKEGLGQARKEDPKEVERNKTRKWLTQALATLNDQIDAFEAEIEAIGAQGKGGKGKSSRGKSMDDLDIWVEKHRLHERRMEQILRMIDNESLESDAVNAIQDQLEYYLESNQDADFAEDEALYDELGLDDLPAFSK
ncbi:CCR4-Not complex component, Not N-terminal domain-containing protein [Pavlovales sp. CCMP2436]|nr:CCR4-Not complex component, Not N-terminal domain-containing protein [Pavlovales sp. CCMP2436]